MSADALPGAPLDAAGLDAIEQRCLRHYPQAIRDDIVADVAALVAALRAAWRERDLVMDETAGLEVEVERLRDAWRLADADRYRVYRERDQAIAERDAALRQRDEARAEERRAIVAWLHRRAQEVIRDGLLPETANTQAVYVASIEGEAARIERGEHLDDAAPGAARPPEEGA